MTSPLGLGLVIQAAPCRKNVAKALVLPIGAWQHYSGDSIGIFTSVVSAAQTKPLQIIWDTCPFDTDLQVTVR